METYTFAQFPAPYSQVHIALFNNVSNAPEIRERLISAATMTGPEGDAARSKVDFGFIERRLIVSRQHLMTAVTTTLLLSLPMSTGDGPIIPKTRSHNLHSELLLTLAPNNNISESIRRHGISDATDSLIVLRYGDGEAKEIWQGIEAVVDGELVSLGELDSGEGTDWAKVDKTFKLSELNHLPLSASEIQGKKIAAVVNTTAVKSVT